ncbi:MarR family transcriptional regulator [Microbacterium sp. CH12i]|uniref:MarR family transcriptional regulator n=1 Tax=Microbacterium sp. CH12i TaxID=1479651 RepID=UPI000691BE32|nr:MarR family transcriptional regulator [Microbacterium sp. CH12i]
MDASERSADELANMRYFSTDSDLVDRSHLSEAELAQCVQVMQALHQWQNAARALSAASKRYMKLNESDMRAIRMLIRAKQQGQIITPKDIAREVEISSASTTKLVDRLVAGDHVIRSRIPATGVQRALRSLSTLGAQPTTQSGVSTPEGSPPPRL